MSTYVEVICQTSVSFPPHYHGCKLMLEWCCYHYDNGGAEYGYRTMWVDAIGRHMPHMGQARVPARHYTDLLWAQATVAGWGHLDEEDVPPQYRSRDLAA